MGDVGEGNRGDVAGGGRSMCGGGGEGGVRDEPCSDDGRLEEDGYSCKIQAYGLALGL